MERMMQIPVSSSTTATTATKIRNLIPLMTLYLTDDTSPDEIDKAYRLNQGIVHAADDISDTSGLSHPLIVGVKYYPANVTTNSAAGVTNIAKCYPLLSKLQEYGMMLCIHSEVTDPHVDIFDREAVFIDTILKPLVADFPSLKITLEHVSTAEAVSYLIHEAPITVKASVTPQHLLYNRNRTFIIVRCFDCYCMCCLMYCIFYMEELMSSYSRPLTLCFSHGTSLENKTNIG
jgi:dihydroorotase (homodimeric type)